MADQKQVRHPAAAYVAPFVVYLVFLMAEQAGVASVFVLYPIKTLAVAAVLVWGWRRVRDDLRERRGLLFGTLVGIAALGIWVAPELLRLTHTDFTVGGFNPTALAAPHSTLAILFRVAGAVLVVPVMEELFWRGWMIRWLVKPDFRSVPLGTFSWESFGVTVLLFGIEHNTLWHVGMITGVLYNWILYRTKSLWACILAHAVTNLLLAIYILATGKWGYW
ncbi:MAG: CAAX prenyl protease-related protein [Verrucomicrobia bacterium]|nr:CAAX prenyl protease-related protein [Verrucomicrobiota bacterium]